MGFSFRGRWTDVTHGAFLRGLTGAGGLPAPAWFHVRAAGSGGNTIGSRKPRRVGGAVTHSIPGRGAGGRGPGRGRAGGGALSGFLRLTASCAAAAAGPPPPPRGRGDGHRQS